MVDVATLRLPVRPALAGVGLVAALVALAGLWVWERHGVAAPEGVLPEAEATSPVRAQGVTDAQLEQAVRDIKKRLRPDEAARSGAAEESSRARAQELTERSDQLQGALDGTRRERDRLLAENDRLAASNHALRAREAALVQALLKSQRDLERERDEGPAVRPQAGSPTRSPVAASDRDRDEGLVELVATGSDPSPDGRAELLQRLIDDLGAREVGDGSLITAPLDVEFAPGTADLAANSGSVLMRLARLARLYDAGTVRIGTDAPLSADRAAGGALSRRRAQAVADALASAYGLRAVVTAASLPVGGGPGAVGTIRAELER